MTYGELEINAEISLREKDHEECRLYKTVKYRVVSKYPYMCIVEDCRGRRRGVAVGELVMNKVITQEPCLESLRDERHRCGPPKGWHKKNTEREAEHSP